MATKFQGWYPIAWITKPIRIDWSFWCNKCNAMAFMRTCPHDDSDRVIVSGTKMRKALNEGGDLPDNFSRPEAALRALRRSYRLDADSTSGQGTCPGGAAPAANDKTAQLDGRMWGK